MIRLSISIAVASIVIRWTLPDAGCYYLYSTQPGQTRALMEASGYVDQACHAAITLPLDATNKLFYVRFDPEL